MSIINAIDDPGYLRWMTVELEIDLLRTFAVVADTRSFTLAARQLGRVQSSISMRIKRLEAVVGCRVFERGNEVVLTPQGQVLLGHTRKILDLNAKALCAMREPQVRGTVRLGTTDTYATCLLPGVLNKISQTHPEVVIDIHCDRGWNILKGLDTGDLDLALVARQPNRADGELIRQERLIWICEREFEVYKNPSLPLAVFPEDCYYRALAIEALDAQSRAWHIAYTSASHMGLMASVLSGNAITVMTEGVLEKALRFLGNGEGFPTLPTVDVMLYQSRVEKSPMVRQIACQIMLHLRRPGLSESLEGEIHDRPRSRTEDGGVRISGKVVDQSAA